MLEEQKNEFENILKKQEENYKIEIENVLKKQKENHKIEIENVLKKQKEAYESKINDLQNSIIEIATEAVKGNVKRVKYLEGCNCFSIIKTLKEK